MVDDVKVIGEFPYPTFRRCMSALAAAGTGRHVSVRTGVDPGGKQGGPWTMISLPAGGGHEVFVAAPFPPEPGEEPGSGREPYRVSLSHMVRCLHEKARTVKLWIGSNEGEVLGVSLDGAEPVWECIRTEAPGDAPWSRPAFRHDAAYLEKHIVTEIAPTALLCFVAAVRAIGHREEIFVTPHPVQNGGCGRALLFSIPAGGRSILGLTAPYVGKAPEPYATNDVEAIHIPAPLLLQMAVPGRPVGIVFGSSEGVYIRFDCRRNTTPKCLEHSKKYPYIRSLPPLGRPGEIKVDARLAAVLLQSQNEQKRLKGEEWAARLTEAAGADAALRRSIAKTLERGYAPASDMTA